MDSQLSLIADKLTVHMGSAAMNLPETKKVIAFINTMFPFDCMMKKDRVYKDQNVFEIWTCSKRIWSLKEDGATDRSLLDLRKKLDAKKREVAQMEMNHDNLMDGSKAKGKTAEEALMSDEDSF